MVKFTATLLGIIAAASAVAQDNAVTMSRDELLAFLPGTKVTHVASTSGSIRHWTNEPDGKFIVSSDNRKLGNSLGTSTGATGHGAWSVNDAGKYCVDIDWKRLQEKWCSKVNGTYFSPMTLKSLA